MTESFRFLKINICILFLLVNGCASTSNIGNIDDTLQEDYVPLDEEYWARDQADLFHKEFVEKGLIYNDPSIEAYLNDIEHRLLSGRNDIKEVITPFIIRSPVPNAFAMPNGNIYFNSGLFTMLKNEQELAAIFSHEISHITELHSLKSIIDRKNTLIGAHVADFMTGGLGLVYLGAAAGIVEFSREQESEADRVGLERLMDAGYDPNAMVEAFQSFKKHPELKHVKQSIYSSHPSYENRIEMLENFVESESEHLTPSTNPANIDSSKFQAVKAKMMEESFQMRLRNRQFHLAQFILDQAEVFFKSSNKMKYYQGEIYRGFYLYPEDAVKEKYWIDTGKDQLKKEIKNTFELARPENLDKSIASYRQALEGDEPYVHAYARLGDMLAEKGDLDGAIDQYTLYLNREQDARDSRRIMLAISRIEAKKAEKAEN